MALAEPTLKIHMGNEPRQLWKILRGGLPNEISKAYFQVLIVKTVVLIKNSKLEQKSLETDSCLYMSLIPERWHPKSVEKIYKVKWTIN